MLRDPVVPSGDASPFLGQSSLSFRFSRLLPGYHEVALGLLSEEEAVTLMLGTAEISTPAESHLRGAATISKLCGFLVRDIKRLDLSRSAWSG